MLLLDEIEKAHPDLFNILLQVMDHGKLTDHNGKSVDFRNVILIMTTNAGAQRSRQGGRSASAAPSARATTTEAINRMFTPEFRNRLDAVIAFAGLPPEIITKVVEKFVFQLEAQLGRPRRHHRALATRRPSGWPRRGYDEKFGARPLARVIQEHIKKPLADELLFGKLKHGGIVRVLVEEKADEKMLGFEYLEARHADPSARSRGHRSRR